LDDPLPVDLVHPVRELDVADILPFFRERRAEGQAVLDVEVVPVEVEVDASRAALLSPEDCIRLLPELQEVLDGDSRSVGDLYPCAQWPLSLSSLASSRAKRVVGSLRKIIVWPLS
jgi:hypothetical protein